jgi:hypothetical protein
MMNYQTTIQTVREQLSQTYQALDLRFQLPQDLRLFQPAPESWCIDEILEHITLTSHFLMLVIRTNAAKAQKRALSQAIPEGESDLQRIEVIADPDAFGWIRPEHMEPTRRVSSEQVRKTMKEQYEECLALLDQLSKGEGALCTMRMSVQNLGRLDLYQWLYFLALHAQRHEVEIARIVEQWQQERA